MKMLRLCLIIRPGIRKQPRTQMTEVFGHEAHAGVEEHLLDTRSSQGRVEERHQDLEDSRELPGEQWGSFQQSSFQQTHHTLQLHVQLKTTTTT